MPIHEAEKPFSPKDKLKRAQSKSTRKGKELVEVADSSELKESSLVDKG